jgi:SNF2 family DNA or RNA helicase
VIDLFPFQKEDVDHLEGVTGALNANDMGTGKTYEAIERDARIRAANGGRGATLVVAPLTILEDVWQAHFEELTDLKVVVCDPKDRKRSWSAWHVIKGDVFVVHWEALRLMPELAQAQWLHVIADECHRAKNRKAQQTKALKSIPHVGYKTAMSGTPVINRPDELWSILNWLHPRVYTSYWKFFGKYVETETKYFRGRTVRVVVGPKNLHRLREELEPFYVRRRKEDVLPDLPEKYYTEIKVDLTPVQRRAYDTMRKEMIAWIGNQEAEVLAAPVVIAQLIRLQQFAVAFAEYDEDGDRIRLSEPSSKLDALMEVLDESEEPLVVFSRFRQLVDLAAERFRQANISFVTLTGDTSHADRRSNVEKFQKGNVRVFIGTLGAGGVGITLTRASTVCFLDRDWSPALNRQAEDRLHRIGQQNAVQVIDITARRTVDLGKKQMLDLKESWIRAILGDPQNDNTH